VKCELTDVVRDLQSEYKRAMKCTSVLCQLSLEHDRFEPFERRMEFARRSAR
jgi:hypothetical protein